MVTEFFKSSTVAKFNDAKWKIKLEDFDELQEQIKKTALAKMLKAVANFVRAKMKDWKESNLNLKKLFLLFLIALLQIALL